MKERQKRLIEVYDHLRRYYGIHTKTGFSEAIRYGRTSLSAAMNGDDSYLTDKLFKKICEAYKGVFNLDYLLTGEGDLLTIEEDVRTSDVEKASHQPFDVSTAKSDMLEMYARMIRGVDDLRFELNKELAEVRALKEDLHQAVYDFRDATYRLTQALKTANPSIPIPRAEMAAESPNY